MKHKAKQMDVGTSKPKEVWYVDSDMSNHMMKHEEWFSTLEKSEQPRFIKSDDDTSHPIDHIDNVTLSHVSKRGIVCNVLHVQTIAKNLV